MINYDQNLLNFINSQKLITISIYNNELWICNVYFAFDTSMKRFIFISKPEAKHSVAIANNPKVAFTTAWFDQENLANRKSIQATGKCFSVDPSSDEPNNQILKQYIDSYHEKFPSSKDWLTFEYLKTSGKSKLYAIEAEYIKFWNDEFFGKEGVLEYS